MKNTSKMFSIIQEAIKIPRKTGAGQLKRRLEPKTPLNVAAGISMKKDSRKKMRPKAYFLKNLSRLSVARWFWMRVCQGSPFSPLLRSSRWRAIYVTYLAATAFTKTGNMTTVAT